MKTFLALVIGILVGGAAVWFLSTSQGRSRARATGEQIDHAAATARAAIQDRLKSFQLRPEEIRDELARTGQVVRRKTREAGKAIADATADARTTAAVKAKLLAEPGLSSLAISVNTTGGVVTLSGSVSSPDDIGKVMLLTMETEGVSEVVSTLQVRARAAPTKS